MNLETTNLLLGIMAAVSVLEAVALAAAGYFGYRAYRQVMTTITDIQDRQIAPVVTRVNAILDDMKDVSARVTQETHRMDEAINRTIDRVSHTADGVKMSVQLRTSRFIGFVRGLRTALESFLTMEHTPPPHYPPAGATRVM